MKLNKQSHYLFSIRQLHVMLLCLYNRSGQAKSLKKVFNVTKNKANSITDIFLLKYYLDLGLLQLYSREIFSENFFKNFAELSERFV